MGVGRVLSGIFWALLLLVLFLFIAGISTLLFGALWGYKLGPYGFPISILVGVFIGICFLAWIYEAGKIGSSAGKVIGETLSAVKEDVEKRKTTPRTKTCQNCGQIVPYTANYCPNCGKKIQ